MARVSLISLGCPKNLLDSECALGEIVRAGHELAAGETGADVIVVNTCGFIESAREESVEAILDAIEQKTLGRCKAVIVIGCLSQRYGRDLAEAEPEIDAVLGIEHSGKLAATIESVLASKKIIDRCGLPSEWVEPGARVRSTPPWTAYIKISDGCDNRCAYCAIPDIRGPYRGRLEGLIIDEAKRLADAGVRELILIGQDLTQYGSDMGGSGCLPDLLGKLNEIEPLHWIRLMYCYPTKVTPELIGAIASLDKVVKYLDLPLQHADDDILRAMNRRGTSADYERLIDALRAACPEIALRSSLIVGFPGETDAAFDRLLAFVERICFDRLGVFAYSREEGTPAASMKNRVPKKIAHARYDRLMRAQQRVSLEKNKAFIGKTLEVLIEGETDDGAFGRSYRDAPEIDGVVYMPEVEAAPGQFVQVKIEEAREYDLVGERVKKS